jgi:hypothetical protein
MANTGLNSAPTFWKSKRTAPADTDQTSIFTAGAPAKVTGLTLSNYGGSAVDVTVHRGGTGDAYEFLPTQSLGAGEVLTWESQFNVNPGESLYVTLSAATVNVWVDYEDVVY